MNIFEEASRHKVRFSSPVGDLTLEQVWDLPRTTSGNKLDLNKVGTILLNELKDIGAGAFIEVTPNPKKALLDLKLELLKHIDATKKAEEDAARKEASDRKQLQDLLDAYEAKKKGALDSLSLEELEAKIAALKAA